MKALVFSLIFTSFAAFALAQKLKPNAPLLYSDNEGIEIYPEFPGGNIAFTKYIQKNVKWPSGEKHQGSVIINFIVERNGKLTGIKVIKSLSPLYDIEAIKVIKNSPRWHPGKLLDGKNVKLIRIQQSVPIYFSIP